MTITQTRRLAAAAIAVLIVAALFVIPDTRSLIVDDLLAPVFGPAFEMIGMMFGWVGDILKLTVGGLFGELGELWDSAFA
jgi:hypothetical protein